MNYRDVCPPCGTEFTGDDKEQLVSEVIAHARDAHQHTLSREHVLAHIEGRDPHDGNQ